MTPEEVEPSQKKKTVPEPPSTFSSLPDEITENILARISRWHYPSLSLVSKRFHSLLSSIEIYKTRSQVGAQETCLYVLLKLPGHRRASWFSLRTKPNNQDSSGMSVVPIPSFPTNYFPQLRSIKTFGSYMYIIGGPYIEPSSSVCIFDFRHHTWRDGPNMSVARKNPHTVLLDEKIYVMGGCDIDKYYANWIEVFDLKTESWTALPGPDVVELRNHLRERHIVNVFEGNIYLVVDDKEYTYEPKDGTWKLVKEISSFLSDHSVKAWCEIGKVICCCTRSGLMWSSAFEIEGRVWREIKGLENLHEHPTRGLKTGCAFAVLDCGGKLFVMWYPRSSGIKSRNKIWYAKISLESRGNGRELWGNVECVNVLTFPCKSYLGFRCVAALV